MPGETFSLRSTSEAETLALGAAMGRACRGGEILLLEGDLGAGKTCLTRGLARGLGIPEDDPVTSPTFVLHCQYMGQLELNHIDAYRLQDARDVASLGFEEYFGAAGVVTVVEWPQYLDGIRPAGGLLVTLTVEAPTERAITCTPLDPSHAAYLQYIIDTSRPIRDN